MNELYSQIAENLKMSNRGLPTVTEARVNITDYEKQFSSTYIYR